MTVTWWGANPRARVRGIFENGKVLHTFPPTPDEAQLGAEALMELTRRQIQLQPSGTGDVKYHASPEEQAAIAAASQEVDR